MSKCLSPLYITSNEANLINEINTWHLNWSNQFCKINARIDYLIDFEDLFDSSITVTMVGSSASPSFLFQPITTLEAASRTIEMWKERQDRLIDDTYSNPTVSKSLSKSNPSTSKRNGKSSLISFSEERRDNYISFLWKSIDSFCPLSRSPETLRS